MPAHNITIYEMLSVAGGSMDGSGNAESWYVNRGEREPEAYMECLWYLFSKVPSLKRPGQTVLDETRAFNEREPIRSLYRIMERCGQKADYESMLLQHSDRNDLIKLMLTS